MNHTDRSLVEFANTINNLDEFGRGRDKKKRVRRGGMSANKTARTAYNLNKVAQGVEAKGFRNAVNGVRSPEETKKLAGSLRKMAGNRVNAVKVAKVAKTAGKVGAAVAGAGLLGAAGLGAIKKMRSKKNA